MNLETRAKEFATEAHFGQVRKYTGVAYITHPEAVVRLVKSVEHTEEMIAAAWLHDVLEDCYIEFDTLVETFGFTVANLVLWLTDVSKLSDGNRAARKLKDLNHLPAAPPQAKTIKLADSIDNAGSIRKYDPEFAKIYIPEKIAQLHVLKEGARFLWETAHQILSS